MALNITETEALRTARANISSVRAELISHPSMNEATRKLMIGFLKEADENIKMVLTMKGYYPK